MKRLIIYLVIIFLGCFFEIFGCKRANTEQIMFEAKIVEWKSDQTFPVGDHVLEKCGASKIKITSPDRWRGIIVEVLVTSDEPDKWMIVGALIRFVDTHGEMNKYLEEREAGKMRSVVFFDTAFDVL